MALQNKTKKKHVRVLCVVFGRCFCESVFVQTTMMMMMAMAITNEKYAVNRVLLPQLHDA